MNSFKDALRTLVDQWRNEGTPIEELVGDLQDEIESLEELEE